jgi:hypothetical protein
MVSWPTLRSRAAILAPYSVMTDASASSALPVVLRRPELNQVGRQGALLRRIAPADGAAANVLAQQNLELRRVAPAYQFRSDRWSSPTDSLHGSLGSLTVFDRNMLALVRYFRLPTRRSFHNQLESDRRHPQLTL